MPPLSKVMRTSIVAFGGSPVAVAVAVVLVLLVGAKASRRRAEIFSVDQVVVIESGKFLGR